MTLEIAQLGQPILRQRAREVSPAEITTPEFQRFLDDMLATAAAAHGVGLAGPQVFRAQRVFVAGVLPAQTDDEEEAAMEIFINPVLTPTATKILWSWEGCLSFMELLVLVPRCQSLRVDYLNRHGQMQTLELSDFPARVVQHEFDHLEGILTLDRAPSTRYIIKATEIEAARKELGQHIEPAPE